MSQVLGKSSCLRLKTKDLRLYCPSGASLGAPVPDEPRNSRLPSARIRSAPLARLAPFFARYPSTVISVPGSSDCLVNPRRTSVFGVPLSIIHSVVVPSAFFTLIWIQECGLIHSILITVPFRVMGCLASYSAENE